MINNTDDVTNRVVKYFTAQKENPSFQVKLNSGLVGLHFRLPIAAESPDEVMPLKVTSTIHILVVSWGTRGRIVYKAHDPRQQWNTEQDVPLDKWIYVISHDSGWASAVREEVNTLATETFRDLISFGLGEKRAETWVGSPSEDEMTKFEQALRQQTKVTFAEGTNLNGTEVVINTDDDNNVIAVKP